MGIPVSELVQLIKDMGKKVIFAGDAAKMHEEYFTQELGDDCKIAPGTFFFRGLHRLPVLLI